VFQPYLLYMCSHLNWKLTTFKCHPESYAWELTSATKNWLGLVIFVTFILALYFAKIFSSLLYYNIYIQALLAFRA